MKKAFKPAVFLIGALSLIKLSLPPLTLAHCPLCVAGAGIGLTLSRVLGIDDTITGVWLGAFLGAISFWAQMGLGRKWSIFRHPVVGALLYILTVGSTIWSFYKFNLIVKHIDVLGFDKLTFGILVGAGVFYLVDLVNDLVIKTRGKSFFPYQRLAVGLTSVLVTSLFVYILINYYI